MTKHSSLTIIAVVLIAAILTGCASASKKQSRSMDSWKGSHKRDLIASWGPPQSVISDGKGGEILIYQRGRTSTTSSYNPGIAHNFGVPGSPLPGHTMSVQTQGRGSTQTSHYSVTRSFYVNSKGIIYSWRWSGL